MKIKAIVIVLLLGSMSLIRAEDVIQVAVWDGVPNYTNYDVSGLKIGFPISGGDGSVYGWELGLFAAMSRDVTGLQTSILFNSSSWVDGGQISLLVNKIKNDYSSTAQFAFINLAGAFQVGVVNASDDAFQIGLLNFNQKGFLPIFPIMNFSVK